MLNIRVRKYGVTVFSLVLSLFLPDLTHSQQPLQICATVPELGSLVREIGGEQVAVTVFAKGTEDPHFIVPKPSFIKALNQCDAYAQSGFEVEVGWASVLMNNARNRAVLPGGQGYIDASVVITPLGAPTATVDRSMGDVHALGNPHFLLSPLNGLRVARLLRDRLSALRLESGPYFSERYDDFRQRLGIALVGEALYNKYDFEKLAILAERGRLNQFLSGQGEESLLGGWFGMLQPYYGAKVVADHKMWPYFAQLFGLTILEHLEPLPGIPPTTNHLQTVIELMRANKVKAVLASAYYDPRYAEFVAENTGAAVVNMAHQGDARPGTETYLDLIDYNVKQLSAALGGNT
jgi:ABC-type Zn uptake system ZnuABC Zn-binding protein ZnuA